MIYKPLFGPATGVTKEEAARIYHRTARSMQAVSQDKKLDFFNRYHMAGEKLTAEDVEVRE